MIGNTAKFSRLIAVTCLIAVSSIIASALVHPATAPSLEPMPLVPQPAGIVLSGSGTSTISWPFDTTGWQQTFGSSLHTGDDDFAQDWSRGSGQTAGQNAYAAISGTVVKSYFSTSTYGHTVVIYDSEHGFAVRYAHLQARSVSEGQTVEAGTTIIGQVGNSGSSSTDPFNPHLHIVLYRNVTNTTGRPIAFVDIGDANSPYRAPFVFTADRTQGCASGPTTLRNRDGGPPIHPPGSLLKTASNSTVYLIDAENRKRPITSASVLAQLYNQSTDARTGTNFTGWVTTVAQDELDLYEQGGNISAAQPGNGKPFPEGKLIGLNGEISIVTGGGRRRPFATSSTFTGLGFNFCQVVNVSQTEYSSYPAGPPVEAMPMLTFSLNLSPSAPYTQGQSITGSFTIKNVGFQSVSFSNLGVGGRLNGSTISDMNFVTTTLAAGSSFTYNSQPKQLVSAGSYNFFAAYQENNGHWAVSVPAAPGVVRGRQVSVNTAAPPSAPTANAASGVTGNSFTASWGSSAGATGYRLDVSASSTFGGYIPGYQDSDVGNVLSRGVGGLSPGTTYYYRVRAYNGAGTSGNSATIAVTTTPQNRTIMLSASPADGGTLDGGGTFPAGASRTVTATANAGYTFSNWTEGGVVVSSSAGYTFTLDDDRTLVANFTQVGTLPPPALVAPGTNTQPGLSVATLTPTFEWQPVAGSDGYGLYVSKFNGSTYDPIFNSESDVGRPLPGTSYQLPAGRLQDGGQYRWSMSTHNGAGYGTPNVGPYYFSVSLQAAALRIDSVSPATGRASGGQQVTLRGSFNNLSAVLFGGAPASVVSGSATQVVVVTPQHAVGA